MFINYSANTDILSINSYRSATGYANSDVIGLVDDIMAGHDGSCALANAQCALEDASAWQGSDVTPELLERLHTLVIEHNAD